jgi:hypothetical protein
MGLLDDAIREHLELKRRHGADPEEVTRQEREALGAPVRGEFAKPDAAEAGAPAEVEEDLEDAPVDEVAEVPEIAEPPEMPGEPERDPEPVEPPPAAREPEPEPQPGTEEDPWLVEDLADPEPPRRPEPGAAAAPEAAEGEDVLEETPEFLQETPEHERLWFEQKPPRDFDWDK